MSDSWVWRERCAGTGLDKGMFRIFFVTKLREF